jgi:hypothetical protein
LAGLCEIGGGYLVWLWLREGKSLWYGMLGAIILILYGADEFCGFTRSRPQEQRHAPSWCHACNKGRRILCHKPPHSRQRLHKRCGHRGTRQAASRKHKSAYASLDKCCPLMEAMADLVIAREDNPPTRADNTKPFHIMGILAEMIIVYLDHRSGLPESIGYHVLPETPIEEKDKRVYAA